MLWCLCYTLLITWTLATTTDVLCTYTSLRALPDETLWKIERCNLIREKKRNTCSMRRIRNVHDIWNIKLFLSLCSTVGAILQYKKKWRNVSLFVRVSWSRESTLVHWDLFNNECNYIWKSHSNLWLSALCLLIDQHCNRARHTPYREMNVTTTKGGKWEWHIDMEWFHSHTTSFTSTLCIIATLRERCGSRNGYSACHNIPGLNPLREALLQVMSLSSPCVLFVSPLLTVTWKQKCPKTYI